MRCAVYSVTGSCQAGYEGNPLVAGDFCRMDGGRPPAEGCSRGVCSFCSFLRMLQLFVCLLCSYNFFCFFFLYFCVIILEGHLLLCS